MIDVASNCVRVRRQVTETAQRVGRDPATVRIVAVSKTKPIDMIRRALDAGLNDIGENYVQEAAEKIGRITAPVTWHMIGHLQRNKAARAAALFDVIHTVDSVALGAALARHAESRGNPIRVLVEVNAGGEPTKHGVRPEQVRDLLIGLADQHGLLLDGLMTMAPQASSAEAARPHFRALRVLRDRLQPDAPANAPLRELSMGMTDDFMVAIEEGATIVRIGRAIFGARDA